MRLHAPGDRSLRRRARQPRALRIRGRACARRRYASAADAGDASRAILARGDPLLRRHGHGPSGRVDSQGGRTGIRRPPNFRWASCTTSGSAWPRTIARRSTWYRKAADHGSAAAQRAVGDFYRKGRGVTADAAEAARWYRRAAERRRYPGAISARRACTSTGTGVPRDYASAYIWYSLAASQAPLVDNRKGLLELRNIAAARMTPDAGRRGGAPRSPAWKPSAGKADSKLRRTPAGIGLEPRSVGVR